MDFDESGSPGRFFTSLVRELKSIAISNIEYFKDGKLSHHAKFHVAFCMLFEYLDLGIEPYFREISQRVHEFDASPSEKGNGYRSQLRIVQKCCLHLLQISRHISTNKESMLFRRVFYMKELEAYVATLGQLRAFLYYALKIMTYSKDGALIPDEKTLDAALMEQLMMDVETLSLECFYGRCLGFQFCESMQRPLQVIAIAMAAFAEGYQENSQLMKVATSLFNSGKYIMNPDLRAQQISSVTRTAGIQFCKQFWSITESEIMHQLPSMVCPAVAVDEVFHLGPDAFDMPSTEGGDQVTITPPCAHTGPAPVQVRLISYQLREGQEQHLKSTKSPSTRSPVTKAERSPGLLFHVHGGGFVAQSSRSHEVYLRDWAKELNVPILSVDYSLAPESPFPRALEECFYAYAWAVHNCDKLGSTGEVIVMAGDSAGGNLILSTAMRAASFDIRRPDSMLGVYPCVLAQFTPSPSRLLCLMDPLLPAGILARCLAAYAGVSDELSSQLAASVSCHIESSAATLRMTSHEEEENSEWIVVNQDSAARTDTALASSASRVSRSDSTDSDDVIFTRPKPKPTASTPSLKTATTASLSSMVSGATDRFVSYVGTYLPAKAFSFTSPSNPEQIPLTPIQEKSASEDGIGVKVGVGGGVSSASEGGSSIDESPTFYTPLSTPCGGIGSGEVVGSATLDRDKEVGTPVQHCDKVVGTPVVGTPGVGTPGAGTPLLQHGGSSSSSTKESPQLNHCSSSSSKESPLQNHVGSNSSSNKLTSMQANCAAEKEDENHGSSSSSSSKNPSPKKADKNVGAAENGEEIPQHGSSSSSKNSSPKKTDKNCLAAQKEEEEEDDREMVEICLDDCSLPAEFVAENHPSPVPPIPSQFGPPFVPSKFGTADPVENEIRGASQFGTADTAENESIGASQFGTVENRVSPPASRASKPIASRAETEIISAENKTSQSVSSPTKRKAADKIVSTPNSEKSPGVLNLVSQTPQLVNSGEHADATVNCKEGLAAAPPSIDAFSIEEDRSTPVDTKMLSEDGKDGDEKVLTEDEKMLAEDEKMLAEDEKMLAKDEKILAEDSNRERKMSVEDSDVEVLTKKGGNFIDLERLDLDAGQARSEISSAVSSVTQDHTDGAMILSDPDSPSLPAKRLVDVDGTLIPQDMDVSSDTVVAMTTTPGDHDNHCITRAKSDTAVTVDHRTANVMTTSSSVDGVFFDPLQSPDSGCDSDVDRFDAGMSAVSSDTAVSVSDKGVVGTYRGPSRDGLHLTLQRTTSMPRSISQPVLNKQASFAGHSMSPADFKREQHLPPSPVHALRKTAISMNPYMSPLLAPDELLMGLPHMCFVACHLDPLLDDSVMFAKRLRSLGKTVDLMLLDDLPHGFLNFALASRDAKHGSDLCAQKLKTLLKIDTATSTGI